MSRDVGRRGNEKREEAKGESEGGGQWKGEVEKKIGPFLPSATHI